MLLGLVRGYQAFAEDPLLIVTKDGELPATIALSPQQIGLQANFRQIITHLPKVKGIILGGGTHFHDDYAGLRCLRHYRYLLRFIGIFLLARLLGKKVILLSMGFGPFHRPVTKWLTRIALGLSNHVTVREELSYQEVATWITPDKITRSFDLAALLVPAEDQSMPIKGNILGISMLSMKNLKAEGEEVDRLFWSRVTDALHKLLHHDVTLQVRIFVIRGGQRESDTELSSNLFQNLANDYKSRVEVIPYDSDPSKTLAKIAECKTFIATRFHAGVLSFLAGCRLIFLTYHRKVEDLAKEIGLAESACILIDKDISSELIYGKFLGLLSDDTKYQPTLATDEALARAKVNLQVWKRYN